MAKRTRSTATATVVDDSNPLISAPEARRRCGNPSERTWWEWTRRPDFPSIYRFGKRNYVKLKDIDSWIEAHRRPPRAKPAETKTATTAGA